jgi:hypothetical protein
MYDYFGGILWCSFHVVAENVVVCEKVPPRRHVRRPLQPVQRVESFARPTVGLRVCPLAKPQGRGAATAVC